MKYCIQEWNRTAGWYDHPDINGLRSEAKARKLLAKERSDEKKRARPCYRYRLIQRDEVVLC